jgi:hypothetical protein
VEAFARRWVRIFYQAQSSGDTTAFRALGPECEQCNDFADQIDEVYDAGGTITSDPFSVTGTQLQQKRLTKRPSVFVAYAHQGVTWVRKAGQNPDVYPAAQTERILYLEWNGSGWTVDGMIDVPDDL